MKKIAATQKTNSYKNKLMIDYLYVGGHKCASTWLHDMIVQHPEICAPKQKEPHFFDRSHPMASEDYFSLWDNRGLKGEFTTSYFLKRETLFRIKEHNPDIKLIVSLRNPVERMISHHKHWNRLRNLRSNDIGKYVKSTPGLLEGSLYLNPMKNLFSLFPRENIFILTFDGITKRPLNVAKGVFDFLGVSDGFIPKNLEKKSGEGLVPKSLLLEKSRHYVFNIMHNPRLNWVINFTRYSGLARLYRRLNSRKVYYDFKIEEKIIHQLLGELNDLMHLFENNGYRSLNDNIKLWIHDIEKKWLSKTQ